MAGLYSHSREAVRVKVKVRIFWCDCNHSWLSIENDLFLALKTSEMRRKSSSRMAKVQC